MQRVLSTLRCLVAALALFGSLPLTMAVAEGTGTRYRTLATPESDAPPFRWTGLYIGAGAGGALTDTSVSISDGAANVNGLSGFGYQGDLKAGFDLQAGPFVFGVFGTWMPDGFGDSKFTANFGPHNITGTTSVHGTAGARGGIVVNQVLLYGGYQHVWADVHMTGPGGFSNSQSTQGHGFVIGNEAPISKAILPINGTWGLEYGYAHLDPVQIVPGSDAHKAQVDHHQAMFRVNIRTNLLSGN